MADPKYTKKENNEEEKDFDTIAKESMEENKELLKRLAKL